MLDTVAHYSDFIIAARIDGYSEITRCHLCNHICHFLNRLYNNMCHSFNQYAEQNNADNADYNHSRS